MESEAGRGSTFYFTARFRTQPDPFAPVLRPSIDMTKIRTLIVDDNGTNRMILNEMVAAWGASATTVEDGYQAISELDRAKKADEPYQLVLLDRRMPGMDGFQVAEHIVDDLGIVDMTIMMLTSDNRANDITRCQELGISRYLVKPVKRSELLRAITNAMGPVRLEVEESRAATTAATVEDQRPLSILLVEDSQDNRILVQAFLKDTPYQIDVAENGEIAVRKFISEAYDLVLMDMQMPVMDGYSATKAVREWETEQGVKSTPIIALTAYAQTEDTQKSLDAGCNAHITKPIKKATLLEAIDEYTREG